MPGIFLGLKFQACVFFWVCNMKLRRTPCHVYFEYPPGVLFSLYKVHANKKALVQKEKSKVLLSCKVHKKTCKHLRKTSWILVENSVWRNRRVSETPFF